MLSVQLLQRSSDNTFVIKMNVINGVLFFEPAFRVDPDFEFTQRFKYSKPKSNSGVKKNKNAKIFWLERQLRPNLPLKKEHYKSAMQEVQHFICPLQAASGFLSVAAAILVEWGRKKAAFNHP